MDFIVTDVLSGELIPVLLGFSDEAVQTAHRMFRKYGVVSHVFCQKVPLSMRFSLCMKYHIVSSTHEEKLMVQALLDYASQLENADVILYLIPCTERYANMIWHHRSILESRFVIAEKEEMERVWFGAPEAETGGNAQ